MMNRRLWLTRIVKGFSITGAGFLAFPFFRALIPTADDETSLEVSVDDLRPAEVIAKKRDLLDQYSLPQSSLSSLESVSVSRDLGPASEQFLIAPALNHRH